MLKYLGKIQKFEVYVLLQIHETWEMVLYELT